VALLRPFLFASSMHLVIFAGPDAHLAGGAYARDDRTTMRLDLCYRFGGVDGGPLDDHVELGEV
jgi:hypothetical protein